MEKTAKDTPPSLGHANPPASPRLRLRTAIAIIALLTFGMFADVLFTGEPVVLSMGGCDGSTHSIHWRGFGFGELRRGNFPMWNPHIFSGVPYFSGFQSALLYPPNFLFYLSLPVHRAINWDIAFHVFLAGIFMYLWTSRRRLHPLACLFSAALFMFCGATFPLVFAGHVNRLCVVAWTPLLFLSIDGLFEEHSVRWCLLGVLAVTMQILAGAPQFVFNNAVAAAVYSAFCLVRRRRRGRMALGLLAMNAIAVGLTAVQWLPGLRFGPESVRGGGVAYEFAAMFSLPPENFLSLLTPDFFGDILHYPYWGRWYMWEMTLFLGVTGLALAAYGAASGERETRRFSGTMVVVMLLLALGAYVPLHRVLYEWAPGFNLFRGLAKFRIQAALFGVMLAGIGLDALIRRTGVRRRLLVAALVLGTAVGVAGIALGVVARSGSMTPWQQIMHAAYRAGQRYCEPGLFGDEEFIRGAARFASRSLLIAAATSFCLSALLYCLRLSNRVVYAVALLGILEVFVFARTTRPTFHLEESRPPGLESVCRRLAGDHRFLCDFMPNTAMTFGVSNLAGYDMPLGRYAEFISFAEGKNPDRADEYLEFNPRFTSPLYGMLRCRYRFLPGEDRPYILENSNAMDRLHLVGQWRVLPDRDRIFAAMRDPSFDPRRIVILETAPDPEPVGPAPQGEVRLVDSSTDHLTIEADLRQPAILLITDLYAKGWQARALAGSSQKEYDVMPADYILRAIPLEAGHHHFRVEYDPPGFKPGMGISIATLALFGLALLWRAQRKPSRRVTSPKSRRPPER